MTAAELKEFELDCQTRIVLAPDMVFGWTTGTVLLRDECGTLVGYGSIRRVGEDAAMIGITSSPSGVALLSASLPEAGG